MLTIILSEKYSKITKEEGYEFPKIIAGKNLFTTKKPIQKATFNFWDRQNIYKVKIIISPSAQSLLP